MRLPQPTTSVDVFITMARAMRAGLPMTPRSPNDKEYFAQDWFAQRLDHLGLAHLPQGRNSYPDFWVTRGAVKEGYEIKSLAFTRGGRPARKDIDFNSTIPSGRKQGSDVFLVFFLYTGSGASPRTVHSISVAHGDLINSDHALADEHFNVAVHGFGSYADGFIRNRKMYVLPHPITIDPDGLGTARLIVPSSWQITDPRLIKVKTIDQKVAPETIDSYTIHLRGRGQAVVMKVPSPNAGVQLHFDVFELA